MSQRLFCSPWTNQCPKICEKDYISIICSQIFPLYTKMRQCSFLGGRGFYFGFKSNKIIFKEALNKLFIMLVNGLGNIA